MSLQLEPPRWSDEELEAERQRAIADFRERRTAEPLEEYLKAYDRYRIKTERFLEITSDLAELEARAAEVLADGSLREVFRYLAGPPISLDDLSTLSEVESFSQAALKRSPEAANRATSVIKATLDRRRFVWICENRAPTDSERTAAILVTAALLAHSRTATNRRSLGKSHQESLVRDALLRHGLEEVHARPIPTLYSAPQAGQFCGESLLGDRKADFVVRLWDDRVMPIECKVSNSSTNSVKRLNNDAAAKAEAWFRDFGVKQVVPTAVLSGVYKLHNLLNAQNRGLTLFWAHQLGALLAWIDKTRGDAVSGPHRVRESAT